MRYQNNDKSGLRSRVLTDRRDLPAAVRSAAGHAYVSVGANLPELQAAGVVCCYASFGTEPPTGPLLGWLASRRVRVLLPVLRDDHDLDWAAFDDPDSLAPRDSGPTGSPGRIPEPGGPRLGPAAIATADVVIVPALAVDADGVRLGRGGGSYDRALARVSPPALVVALLYDGEVLDALPHEPHDRHVHAALTPTRIHRFRTPAPSPGA